jgi:arylformamidase
VIDVSAVHGEIMENHLKGRIEGATRIILKTGCNFHGPFEPDYISLGVSAAKLLKATEIIVVGIDSPSIEKFHGNGDVHRELLGKGIVIIEFLELAEVPEGDYQMVALPLRLLGLDGSPARVVLVKSGLQGSNNSLEIR